ncbi:kinase-like domain-containing protein [Suillus clintonianus]|uniref:kinase-like domain-containing protein n=1 Tax=Suillus clintonianus TaxID=1904413 RepID=UPI001B877322|nr:kinase-like domain-containing protein [Suillus clintonianus]KAG2126835.1 kinase-like domain-containing protein [Suillus clintonianus]
MVALIIKKIHPELQLFSSRLLHHDNVVPFLGFKKDGLFHSLVMPWMPNGTLTSFIRTHGAVLEPAAKATLLHDISSGLEHLVHGNLESDNVLITERQSACLSGFRQSVKLSSRNAACPQSQMPPKPAIQFAGPEWFVRRDDVIFQSLPKTLFKSDIYSLGCLIFNIITRRMPWHDATSVEISNQLRKRATPSRPKGSIVNDDQWAFIEPCLSLLPQDRPSASYALNKIKDYLVLIGPPDLTGQIETDSKAPKGCGGFGFVYSGIWTRKIKIGGKVKVAVKVLHIKSEDSPSKQVEKLKRELAAWRRLCHPNIASLLGTMVIDDGRKSLVSLWMEQGSLLQYLEYNRNDILLPQRLLLVNDIAEGLKYLHEYPMVHGDLTPSNVLINDEGRALLTDFGLSVILGILPDLSCAYTDAKAGTLAWAAPELVLFDESSTSSSKDEQSPPVRVENDMYSFACLMYLIVSGNPPWGHNAKSLAIMKRLKAGDRPPGPGNIDARYWKLIVECWAQAPDSRPKISSVLRRLSNIASVQR